MTDPASTVTKDPAHLLSESLSDATTPGTEEPLDAELIQDELLVEEISIDGMCGVY